MFPLLLACGGLDGGAGSELGQASAALSIGSAAAEPPASVGYELELDGQRFEVLLERAPTAAASDYRAFRLTRDRALVPLAPPGEGCSYRGLTEAATPGSDVAGGFAALNVCRSATGLETGQAARGVVRAGGRFWRLSPDPADTDASDGVDHLAQPLHRNDAPITRPEPAQRTTLRRLPESPAPRLAYREGTDAETKYLDLIVVSDAARVAELGGRTEEVTFEFVDTMNALLDTSGLSPRLRVTLRAQVLFEQDPYQLAFDGNEVDNDSLLNEFLDWAASTDLPPHDEHLLLSGLDFVGGVVGYAGLNVACLAGNNGAIVQAGDSGGGFAVLSAVHELGHTLGMNHDDGSRPDCPNQGFIMAAVGCGNCPGAEEALFSACSVEQFQQYLDGPAYAGTRCADDVPVGGAPRCGDGAVQENETCDCGSRDCTEIDPCCNGATCQLAEGAECSDYNDGCCQSCTVVQPEQGVVCRPQRSACDIEEVCGGSKECPADAFEPAGETCEDDGGNEGACYFGDCRTRGSQCEQIAEQQAQFQPQFQGVGAPGPNCDTPCNVVVCGNGPTGCVTIGGPALNDGVPCDGGQCVRGQCVSVVDQCPGDPDKVEPGECGCGNPDEDSDGDGVIDCNDGCPEDGGKQAPGECGCGVADTDRDGDQVADCADECPDDTLKLEPGECGCGNADTDRDGDQVADCADECPDDAERSSAGACGCGVPETDTDADGTPDCIDECVTDPLRNMAPCEAPPSAAAPSSDDGGCSLAAPSAERPGRLAPLAWLALAALPLARRRRRR